MPTDPGSTTLTGSDLLSIAVAGVYSVERFMFLAGVGRWDWTDRGDIDFEFHAHNVGSGRVYVSSGGGFADASDVPAVAPWDALVHRSERVEATA